MLNARQPQAPDAILYLIILPAAFTFKIRNAARKIKTPPSFLTEAFNLSVGDTHTTRKWEPGMAEEETRFFGLNRECGLHEG